MRYDITARTTLEVSRSLDEKEDVVLDIFLSRVAEAVVYLMAGTTHKEIAQTLLLGQNCFNALKRRLGRRKQTVNKLTLQGLGDKLRCRANPPVGPK